LKTASLNQAICKVDDKETVLSVNEARVMAPPKLSHFFETEKGSLVSKLGAVRGSAAFNLKERLF
jgi:hypothetical protein